jgi:hypothetical protein
LQDRLLHFGSGRCQKQVLGAITPAHRWNNILLQALFAPKTCFWFFPGVLRNKLPISAFISTKTQPEFVFEV